MRVLALLVSYVLHPLWTPLLVLGWLWWLDPWLRLQPAVMLYVGSVFLINALAPAVSIYMLHKRGVLGDLEVSERTERQWPFLIVLFYQTLGLFALTRQGVYLPSEVLGLVVAMMASLVLALLVNRRFKMSMHLLANGGAFGAIWAFNRLHGLGLEAWLPLGFLSAGLVGWSRMKLGVHTPAELAVGFLVGFTLMRAVVESGWPL
ncbi:MAG: hypothetical protein CBC74_001925 [Crocinitomicaceae bacterium TMED114]|nr:MAG: hypothetical protein CBC74_001925 [Crocinitomicaceae bacterium TMED114]